MAKNIIRFLDSEFDGELAVASERMVRRSDKGQKRLTEKERRLARRRKQRRFTIKNRGVVYVHQH